VARESSAIIAIDALDAASAQAAVVHRAGRRCARSLTTIAQATLPAATPASQRSAQRTTQER
jgi:hypothetical protein